MATTTRAPRTPAATKEAAAKTTAKKATPGKAPAKKTPAKQTPAKKTTARKAAAKATGNTTTKAATTAARTKPTPAAVKKTTVRPEFITHKMITAHYQARLHGLPTRNIRDWKELPTGVAAIHFPSGARLDHTPKDDAPFHANTPCPGGSIHRQPIRTSTDLANAEKTAKNCTEHAATAAAANIAVTRVTPTTEPAKNANGTERQDHESGRRVPTWDRPDLPGDAITKTIPVPAEPVHRATASAADTQPMSKQAITDGLAARATDTETAKEHPDHA